MHFFKWRIPCKVIAVIDLIISTIFIGVFIVFSVLLKVYEEPAPTQDIILEDDLIVKDVPIGGGRTETDLKILGYVKAVIFEVIIIAAARELFLATKENMPSVPDALEKAKSWRRWNIFLIIVFILRLFLVESKPSRIMALSNVGIRFTAAIIVSLYVQELSAVVEDLQVSFDAGIRATPPPV